MNCLKPNFSPKLASGEINDNLFRTYTTIDELINNISSNVKSIYNK